MAYVPLTMPSLGASPDFQDTANWLAESVENIVISGNSYVQALGDLANINFDVGDLPVFNSVVWLGETTGALVRPDRPDMDIGNIEDLLDQLRQLVPPTAPTEEFSYTEPGYASDLRNPMIAKLLNDLVNGGYGIDPNDETALFNRERDREAAIYVANEDELRRAHASSSFPVPQGVLNRALDRARQDYSAKLSSVNRDIALRRSELFVQHRQRTLENVLRSEDQSIQLYNAIQERLLRAAQTEVQMAIALFEAGVRLFTTRFEGIKAQIDAQLDAARATVQIYAADVNAYAAFVNAVSSSAQISIANSRNVLTRDIAQHQSRVDIIKFELQKLMTTVENSKEINKYGTEFFRTALGSAMNGINGLAVQTSEV